jgi:hypothetical protein
MTYSTFASQHDEVQTSARTKSDFCINPDNCCKQVRAVHLPSFFISHHSLSAIPMPCTSPSYTEVHSSPVLCHTPHGFLTRLLPGGSASWTHSTRQESGLHETPLHGNVHNMPLDNICKSLRRALSFAMLVYASFKLEPFPWIHVRSYNAQGMGASS